MSAYPSGWYPDPEVQGGIRWWGGYAWTAHQQPPGVRHSYAPPGAEAAYAQSAPQSYGLRSVQAYQGGAARGSFAAVYEPPRTTALWEPLYGASLGQAFGRFWRKYADFTGRASRSEFWWAYLCVVLLGAGSYVAVLAVALSNTPAAGGTGSPSEVTPLGGVLMIVWFVAYLGMILPTIAVSVRRLHDAGVSGLVYLLAFVPFGSLVLLYFWLQDSKPHGARYDRPRA